MRTLWLGLLSVLIILLVLTIALIIPKLSDDYGLEMVSGTEYLSGEEAQVIVRIADKYGSPVIGVSCDLTVYYPNKSIHITSRMDYSAVPGNYYHNFTAPDITGIYEEYIRCTYAFRELAISSSFHINPALNTVMELSQDELERYTSSLKELHSLNQSLTHEITELKEEFKKMKKEYSNQLDVIKTGFHDLSSYTDHLTEEIKVISEKINESGSRLSEDLADFRQMAELNEKKINDRFSRLGLSLQEIFG
jgi:methyl-accepting chemotaxis protein